jgi:hypothetical protein
MGACRFCGQPAGFLRSEHAECRGKHTLAQERIPAFFVKSLESALPATRFRELADEVARASFVRSTEMNELVGMGLSAMVDRALADQVLSDAEEARIREVAAAFGFENRLEEIGVNRRLVKARILRDIDAGRIPRHVNVEGPMPLNLGRGEVIIWIFNNASYYTMRTRTQYVGGSHGMSVRIAKGVYYRVGASKGERVQSQQLSQEGVGDFVVTDRCVYFLSSIKVIKLPAKKIVSVTPYADGLALVREGTTAKPQIFVVDDPWFAVNLISRLNQIDE